VNDRVDLQYHGLPITSISTHNVTSRFVAIARLQPVRLKFAAIISWNSRIAKAEIGKTNSTRFKGWTRQTYTCRTAGLSPLSKRRSGQVLHRSGGLACAAGSAKSEISNISHAINRHLIPGRIHALAIVEQSRRYSQIIML
jgi:hypothetical protein